MNAFSRSAATFVGIAVPGVLIAVTAFVAPLPSGSGARGPEQVRLPASATTAVCPGPLSLADDAAGTDEEFEAAAAPTTVARAVSASMTAPDGSQGAAGISAGVLGGDDLFTTDPGDPFVTGADGMGAPVLYTGEPAGESPALVSAVQTADADSGDYAGLAALSCSEPVTRAMFSSASTMAGEDSRLLLGNPTDAPVTVRVSLTGESGPVPVAGADSLTIQPHSMRTVVLGALAEGVPVVGAEVTSEDGRVTAALQHIRRDGLDPRGIEYAAPEAPAATRSVVPLGTGGAVRLRVSNPGDTAVTARLGAHSADGPEALPTGSVAIPAHGTAEVDLGEVAPGDLMIEADADVSVTASVTIDTEEGADVAHYPGVEALGDTQLVALPTDERGGPLGGDLVLAAGEGSVDVVPVGADGQRGDARTLDLDPERALVLGLADFGDARALELRSTGDDAFATVAARSDSGASAVGIPAPPQGVGYQDVRLER